MKAGYLIGAAVETIVKVVIVAAVVVFVFRGATQAYEFGYKVFADEPVSISGGRTITVGISDNMSTNDIAQMLEEKGLIEDARLFVVQELLSAYHGEITPGIYDLSTAMTAQEMLAIISVPEEESEEEPRETSAPEPEVEPEIEPEVEPEAGGES
ncbi:MAG: endolytic transglycosylase MltG [Lachnospiraceae bacterium]|nr:endolytic transglycosylase MltG [Lachnospiraceae bacterium]